AQEEFSIRHGTELFGDTYRRLVLRIDVADEALEASFASAEMSPAVRGFRGIAQPAEFRRDPPADLDIAPALGKPQAAIAGEVPALPVLERPGTKAPQLPVTDDKPDAPPDIAARRLGAAIDLGRLLIEMEGVKRLDIAFAPI